MLLGAVAPNAIRSTSATGVLAVRVNVPEKGVVMVMVLPLANGVPRLLIVVLMAAVVPALAVKVVPFTVTVPVPEVALKVPVWLAATALVAAVFSP